MDNLDNILKEITNNIIKENNITELIEEGKFGDFFSSFYKLIDNPEVNKKIIYSLANLLQN